MDLKVLGLVVLALGIGFAAADSDFTNRLPDFQELNNNESKSKKDFCPEKLGSSISSGLGTSMLVSEDSNKDTITLNVPSLVNWEASDSYRFSCRKGLSEGENVNHYYCRPEIAGSLQYEKIDSEGNIVEQRKINVDRIVLDEDGNVVNVNCSEFGVVN